MAGLRKLRNKFYVRVWIDGKEKLLPTGCTERRDAEKHLRKIQNQELEIKQRIRKEIDELQNRLTIPAGIRYFTDNVGKERNLQESSVDAYKLAIKDFRECLSRFGTFDSLNKKHFTDLVNYLQDRYNDTTVNIRLRGIRAMLNYLLEKEMIDKLPFKIRQIKTDQSLPKFILPDEMSRIYRQVTDERLAAIFRVYECSGMRLSELKQSRREGEFIIILKSKSRKERIIPIPLERIPDYNYAKEISFSPDFISHRFTKACTDAGLKGKTIHCLRHTFALRKLMETNNISLVKELLGHSSVTVTEIYTKFPIEFLSQVFTDRNINHSIGNQKRLEA